MNDYDVQPDYARPGGPWDLPTLDLLAPPRVFCRGGWLSSDEVAQRAANVAGGLRALGIEDGHVVAFQIPPSLDSLVILLGCWYLGAIAMPVHHRYSDREVADLAERARARVVVNQGMIRQLSAARPAVISSPSSDQDALLLATSGSSGRPKIVRHTHRSLAYKGTSLVAAHGLNSADVVLTPAPMAHMGGLLCGVLIPAYAGMGAVYMPRWSPERALDCIKQFKVSYMVGPPTFFIQMLRLPEFDRSAVESLRIVSCGGASVTASFCEYASARLGAWVKRTYGSTEAPSVTTSLAGELPELGWTTDGRTFGDCQLRIDDDTQEILIRGPELFAGYLGEDSNDIPIDSDGWYRSGDKGRIEGGRLSVTGRIRKLIIRGGENIDPTEVENVCGRFPGVTNACVQGVHDDLMGERVGVVLEADQQLSLIDLQDFCTSSGLARFKQPERIVTVSELPTNAFGKVDQPTITTLLTGLGGKASDV